MNKFPKVKHGTRYLLLLRKRALCKRTQSLRDGTLEIKIALRVGTWRRFLLSLLIAKFRNLMRG